MTPFRSALVLLALAASPVSAQPTTGKVQPDRIDLGTVYTGATVEANFMVFEAGNNPNIKLEVTAPKFVKVLNQSTHAQQFGLGNNFVCGTVEIAIDTSAAGERSGEVAVTLGKTKARVPVTATVRPRRAGLIRLLIAETPFERYSTDDGELFRAWTDLVKGAPVDVSYLLVTRGKPVLRDLDLGKYDCVFLGETGLVNLTPGDLKRVRAFAEEGGRVVVAADAFMVGTVPEANKVLAGYGLQMRDEEARGMGLNNVTVGKEDLDPEVVKAGVKSVHFFRASPVAVEPGKGARVLARAVGAGKPGDAFVAMAPAGKGEVIAIGQSLWWNWIGGERGARADNARLLRWLLVPEKEV
ncbi:MAG TPA: DUF4350 domain-containing protein [Gemmataceae bacterium]